MKILPPVTRPPDRRVERRHAPTPVVGRYGYRDYRACLRWEFGFSCAFCLLHETDLVRSGVEGFGVTGVEHYVPVSSAPEIVNDYENCFYVCRLCNGARQDLPVSSGSGRLLNPCRDLWSAHFEAVDDRLQPLPGDADARYTHDAYCLDDARKVRIRRLRRESIEECVALIESGRSKVTALLAHSRKEDDLLSLEAAEELWQSILLAIRELARYSVIPSDAPKDCHCPDGCQRILPAWMDQQTLEI